MDVIPEHLGAICLRAKPSKGERNNFLTLKIRLERVSFCCLTQGKIQLKEAKAVPKSLDLLALRFWVFFTFWSPSPGKNK